MVFDKGENYTVVTEELHQISAVQNRKCQKVGGCLLNDTPLLFGI